MRDRAGTLALATTLALAACASGEPYFVPPGATGVGVPAAPGEVRYVGVAFLTAQEGDDVRLVAAEPIRPLTTVQLRWHALRLTAPETQAAIGAVDETDPQVAALIPLSGALVPVGPLEHPTDQTEVVVEVRSSVPVTVAFEAVRIHFTVNGQPSSQDFPMAVAVCFDEPRPESCPPPTAIIE